MKDTFEEMREKMLQSAKQGIKNAYASEEYALIQAVNAYLETNKSYNLVYERLTEWYGIYFPEIRMTNPKTLTDLAIVLNSKDMSYDKILEVIGDESKAKKVYNDALETIGRAMEDDERKALLKFAKMSQMMDEGMEGLQHYIKIASTRMMPNATFLTDEMIAAELLSKAGSLERLATMPASTVQLLGAEKSLFKHIKFGSRPPKYGVLFKLPEIGTASRETRGRIARVYATKLTIGLKADYFSKHFIAEQLKKDLDVAIKRIKANPGKPKPPTPEYRNDRPQRGGGRGGGRPMNRDRRDRFKGRKRG